MPASAVDTTRRFLVEIEVMQQCHLQSQADSPIFSRNLPAVLMLVHAWCCFWYMGQELV